MGIRSRSSSPNRNLGSEKYNPGVSVRISTSSTDAEQEWDVELAGKIMDLRKTVLELHSRLFICLVINKTESVGMYFKMPYRPIYPPSLIHKNANTHLRTRTEFFLFKYQIEADWIEERVSNLRKLTGLDRKCIFLLSADGDFSRFAQTMHPILLDASLKLYASKIANIKRKRTRVTPPSPSRILSNPTEAPIALSYLGWLIRYDFKLAFMAEIRGEWEESMKAYQSAYQLLHDYMSQVQVATVTRAMFSKSVPNVPPGKHAHILLFSKRWYECKIIFDVIALKVPSIRSVNFYY
jgi:hypothetical protein